MPSTSDIRISRSACTSAASMADKLSLSLIGMPCKQTEREREKAREISVELVHSQVLRLSTHLSGTTGGLVVTYKHRRGDGVVRVDDGHNI